MIISVHKLPPLQVLARKIASKPVFMSTRPCSLYIIPTATDFTIVS